MNYDKDLVKRAKADYKKTVNQPARHMRQRKAVINQLAEGLVRGRLSATIKPMR